MGRVRESWRHFRTVLAPMTPKQKLEYLWTYYKWVPIVLLAVILVGASLISGIAEQRKEVLYGGLAVNLSLSDEASGALTDGLWAAFGGTDPDQQRVTLEYSTVSTGSQTTDLQTAYTESVKITARIAAHEVDYILMNDTAREYFDRQDMSANLETLLTGGQLAELEPRLLWKESDEGAEYPYGVDLSGTAFAAACVPEGEGLYVIFPGNTGREGRIADFLDYLLKWEP